MSKYNQWQMTDQRVAAHLIHHVSQNIWKPLSTDNIWDFLMDLDVNMQGNQALQKELSRYGALRVSEDVFLQEANAENLKIFDVWRTVLVGEEYYMATPDPTNKVTLDKTVKDKWGLNVLNIDCELKENEIKMRKDILADAQEMLEKAGVKNVQAGEGDGTPGRGIHEMGTARMGRDPKTSVLNGNNQVWDAPNVFVTDGAFMTSASCVNPSLTYMAFTARAVDFAVTELKKGNL
jgi:choline dehydrogenase-like flavoprotein